jgi:hypothetical protein
VAPVLISTPSADSPIIKPDSNALILAMFNGTTTYKSKVSSQAWDFSFETTEFTAVSLCLEVWDHSETKIVYNTTNTCHNMSNNRLETPLIFSDAVKQVPGSYLFSVLVSLTPIKNNWSPETCIEMKQTFHDLSSIVSYVPVLGAGSLGSPGLMLSTPEWRKEFFGTCMFSAMVAPSRQIRLNHIFVKGMLAFLRPLEGHAGQEHTCYINQIPHIVRMKYQQVEDLEGDTFGQNNATFSKIQRFEDDLEDEQRYYYPLLSFENAILAQNRTSYIQCPTIEVVGKYLNEQMAGLSYLGSAHLVGEDARSGNFFKETIKTSQANNNSPLNSQHPPTFHLSNNQCADAASKPVYGYEDGKFLTTVPFLTFGSAKNSTFPLISVKTNSISSTDTTSFAIVILDMRGFDLGKKTSPMLQTSLPSLTPTSLQSFLNHPVYASPPAISPSFKSPYLRSDNDDVGPTLSCLTTGYRLDHVLVNVTMIPLDQTNPSQHVHSRSYPITQLSSGLRLNDMNISYAKPENRYHISLQAVRALDIGHLPTIQLSCTVKSGFGFEGTAVVSHGVVTEPIVRGIEFGTQVWNNTAVPSSEKEQNKKNGQKNEYVDGFTESRTNRPVPDLPDFYTSFNMSLVHLNTNINHGLRLTWFGHHIFEKTSLTNCHFTPYGKDNSKIIKIIEKVYIDEKSNVHILAQQLHDFTIPIEVLFDDTKYTELKSPFELDPLIKVPDYIPQPPEKDTVADWKVNYLILKFKAPSEQFAQINTRLLPNTLDVRTRFLLDTGSLDAVIGLDDDDDPIEIVSYNLTCHNSRASNLPLIISKTENNHFSTSQLRFELIELDQNYNDKIGKKNNQKHDEQKSNPSSSFKVLRTQTISIPIFASPPPVPPDPDTGDGEDNTLFFFVFFIVLIIAIIGSVVWLIKLKLLRDKQRAAIIQQQQLQHEQLVNPSYGGDDYTLVT